MVSVVLVGPGRVSAALVECEEAVVVEGLRPEGFVHRPVLLRETVQYLDVRSGGVYVDCTVGEGGHALAVLEAAQPGGRLLGIDLDPHSLEAASRRLQRMGDSFTPARGSYAHIQELLEAHVFPAPDGVLLDVGLSSLQLEGSERGFSMYRDEPLDMRFDPQAPLTAAEVVNQYPPEELARIIWTYGEEPRSRAIARAIAQRRPLTSTLELAGLVAQVKGGARGRTHPATRTFQALRIAVNSELDNLESGLAGAAAVLKPGGILAVISYHSLEDRLVKQFMARESRECICPPRLPVCICEHKPSLKTLTRRIVTPSPEEVRQNRRSRSARMRVAQRLRES